MNFKSFCFLLVAIFTVIGCEKDEDGSQNSTVKDIDGNLYHVVTIGTQKWMVENLMVTKYRNGDVILNIIDNTAWSELEQGAYSWYNQDEALYKDVYGALYNWHAVTDARNIAPEGWHVATDEDWTILTNFLGGDGVAGDKLKEVGTEHWDDPNASATNEAGFTALPGGNRGYNGLFVAMGEYGNWWTADENSATNATNRTIYFNQSVVEKNSNNKRLGFSVRCVKD